MFFLKPLFSISASSICPHNLILKLPYTKNLIHYYLDVVTCSGITMKVD